MGMYLLRENLALYSPIALVALALKEMFHIHVPASLCMCWGSFFVLLHVDNQEGTSLSFTFGEFCCLLVQACFVVHLAHLLLNWILGF